MTKLTQGNKALRDKDYQQAIAFYIEALMVNPELAKVITPNIAMAKQGRNVEREKNKDNQKVAVCGWELSDDTAERVYTLAKLYESFTDVEIIGTLFPEYGGQIWESIRLSSIAVHSFMVDDEGVFLEQALKLVLEHPYDVVHLSQPRITNIFFGLLYKLVWDAKVLVDVVDAGEGVSVDDYLEAGGSLPELKDLNGVDWTRLAFGLVDEFDKVTVSDNELQKYYEGEITHNVQDETVDSISLKLITILQKIPSNIKQISQIKAIEIEINGDKWRDK